VLYSSKNIPLIRLIFIIYLQSFYATEILEVVAAIEHPIHSNGALCVVLFGHDSISQSAYVISSAAGLLFSNAGHRIMGLTFQLLSIVYVCCDLD
jgi:hypothetical protein